MKNLTICICLIISSLLSACNDSADGTSVAANIASVNAGADKTVLEGLPLTLSAAVYPVGGTLVWVQTKGPLIEEFPTEGGLSVEVAAPTISADSELVFIAEYTSLDGQIVTDEITVMVSNVDYSPVSIVTLEEDVIPPFSTYEIVTLLGDASYDRDGEIREYLWTQVDSNNQIQFVSSATESQLQFKAPFVTDITQYTLQLTVKDNMGLVGINTFDVMIAASNDIIVANAGADQSVDEFTIVTIDASESVSSMSAVSCNWQQTYGTETTLNDENSCITSFIAPDVDAREDAVFHVTVTDVNSNTASDQMIVTVNPVNLGTLHDTGITGCYNDNEEIACGGTDFPKQDADTGRDEISSLLDKSGEGPRSFDFTKFDQNGDELPNNATVFSCVRDNFTGLIWEVKQRATIPEFQSLRGAENYYSMDSSKPALSSCTSETNCGVEEFVDNVNDSAFCGGANWRLPSYLELLNIMDYNDVDRSNLLASGFFRYFPDTAVLNNKFYWVSDISAEGGSDDFNLVLDLATGDDSIILMSSSAYVILVRTP